MRLETAVVMQRKGTGEFPLPRGWEEAQDYDGKVFYVDHNTQRTSWMDPRDKLTKPLTFSDCIGDELPYGWEQAFDDQVGVYYMDHINKLTQIEDPRAQWCAEQDRMLKEYLVVARDALDSRQEILQVKQQRLAFAQEEFRQLTAWSDKCGSQTSLHSGSSTSSKYDPEILKADIAEMKARVCRLKRELESMKQELYYKQQGFETLQEIDRKMGNGLQGGFQLDEAQAILQELKSIHKAISSGEKEKRQIMQNLAQLKDGFQMNDRHLKLSESHLSLNHLNLSLSRPCLDTGSQTEIAGDCFGTSQTDLAEKVKLNLQYDETKRRLANIQIELAKLEAEACPGAIEAERDRLLLMHEKEELLRDLCQSRLHKQLPDETQQCKVERRRLEEELHQALTANSEALTRRLQLQDKRNSLLRQLEEATRQASYLHSQLKRLSTSTMSMSSGSSRGSLSASSRGSLSSLSLSDIYGMPQEDYGPPFNTLGDIICQGEPDNRRRTDLGMLEERHALRMTRLCIPPGFRESRESLGSSLSPHSSLSSLSPPGSPLITESGLAFPALQSSRLHEMSSGCEREEPILEKLEEDARGLKADSEGTYTAEDKCIVPETTCGVADSEPLLNTIIDTLSGATLDCGSKEEKMPKGTRSISTAVSHKLLLGCSDIFEPLTNRLSDLEEPGDEKPNSLYSAQVQLELRYDVADSTFTVVVHQLKNLQVLSVPQGSKVVVFVTLLPNFETSKRFCSPEIEVGQHQCLVGWQACQTIAASALHGKTLQIDVRDHEMLQRSLGSVQISLTNLMARLDNKPRHWYNLLNLHHVQEQEPQLSTIFGSHANRQPVVKADKETNTDIRMLDLLVTRPKELCTSFKRANAIVRSQTFSSSARNQYVCRLNRSDSDSSALPKRTMFLRSAVERRSLRMKRPVLQASMKAGRSAHTSLDLELDLQASKAAEERLNDELRSLRELQSRLEYARERDCTHLPTWIRDDVRFQHLLEKAKKQAEWTSEEQLQEQRVERMLKKASKEIFRLRGQSQKVPPQVQFFRAKMEFFTRAKINIPPLPVDDV